MEISLTTNNLLIAVAFSSLVAFTASAAPADEHHSLAVSFPEKVGSFARVSAKKNETAIHGDVLDAAEAIYASGASEIKWRGTEFASSEQAFAAGDRLLLGEQAAPESVFRRYRKNAGDRNVYATTDDLVAWPVRQMPPGIAIVNDAAA